MPGLTTLLRMPSGPHSLASWRDSMRGKQKMPLTEGDVLDALSDPVALGIEFYVDNIHVKGERFTTVREHIRAGNILVKGGDNDHIAYYDHDTDILITQNKSPPLDDEDRALLLHECVHAMPKRPAAQKYCAVPGQPLGGLAGASPSLCS